MIKSERAINAIWDWLFTWCVFTGVFLSLINSILQRPSYLCYMVTFCSLYGKNFLIPKGKMVTFCSLYGNNFLSKYQTQHWIVWFNSFWIINILDIYFAIHKWLFFLSLADYIILCDIIWWNIWRRKNCICICIRSV